jgi:hypothetical protein
MSGGSATGMSPREPQSGPRGYPRSMPVPSSSLSDPIRRKGTLTCLGFLCAFPMIFLSLATNLGATGWAFPPAPPPWELAISFLINLWACILAALFIRLMFICRETREMDRFVPALDASSAGRASGTLFTRRPPSLQAARFRGFPRPS